MKLKFISIFLVISSNQVFGTPTAPESIPDGRGGLTTIFKASHFKNVVHGRVVGDQLILEKNDAIRGGCVFEIPANKVYHADGMATISLRFSAKWSGFIYPREELSATLFMFRVATDSDPFAVRDFMHTSLMDTLTNDVDNSGRIHLTAVTDGVEEFPLQEIDVKKGEKIQVRVCNIAAGASVTFHSVKIHSYPTE